MEWNWKEYNKGKNLFRSYYCSSCKQTKPCGVLGIGNYCCACYLQREQSEAQEYSNYRSVYQQKLKEKKENDKQLLLLKNYQGCKVCGSLEVDAYELYENSRLVCQPCLVKKTGGSSSPISFSGKQKWYKKFWKVDLKEWLEKDKQSFVGDQNFSQLPVNVDCARKWLKDRNHLNNCRCLEIEAQKLVEMFSNSLKECQDKLKKCSCKTSEKVRVDSDYYAWCDKCEESIPVASKKRVIKNRNDPRFWGLNIKEKVLCLNCLQKFQEKMPISKRYMLNKYLKRGY